MLLLLFHLVNHHSDCFELPEYEDYCCVHFFFGTMKYILNDQHRYLLFIVQLSILELSMEHFEVNSQNR